MFLSLSLTQTNFFIASYSINLLDLDLLYVCQSLYFLTTIDWRQKKKKKKASERVDRKKEEGKKKKKKHKYS